MEKFRVNIGCGQTPTAGYRNLDNSLGISLSKIPLLPEVLNYIKIIDDSQFKNIDFIRKHNIEHSDCVKGLPFDEESVEVLYTSHMLEHLDRTEAEKFLKGAFRVLCHGGIIRIVVPDIKKMVSIYNECGDADAFIEATSLCTSRPRSFAQRVRLLLVGTRHHQWMYDSNSLCRLLGDHGFVEIEVMQAGQSKIIGEKPDLLERSSQSIYVEATKK